MASTIWSTSSTSFCASTSRRARRAPVELARPVAGREQPEEQDAHEQQAQQPGHDEGERVHGSCESTGRWPPRTTRSPPPPRPGPRPAATGGWPSSAPRDGSAVFPPRLAQPGTGAPLTWATSAGRGAVHAATVVRRRGEPPASVVLVDLDEGFRMMSAVVGRRARGRAHRAARAPGLARRRPARPGVRGRRVSAGGLRGAVAIAGAAESDLGEVAPGLTPTDLMVQASLRALEDCGLGVGRRRRALRRHDAAAHGRRSTSGRRSACARASTDATQVGGSSPIVQLDHARAAIAAGQCEVALLAYGSTQRSVGRASASVQEISPYEAPYRPLLPVAAYALAASRHLHEFGTTPEQLAAVAVSARDWARRQPAGLVARRRSRSTTSWPPRACATRSGCATAAWSRTAAGRSSSSPPSGPARCAGRRCSSWGRRARTATATSRRWRT